MKKIFLCLLSICSLFYSCTETKEEPEIPQQETVKRITLSKNSVNLYEGKKDTLTYAITPSSLHNVQTVTWTSSASNIAIVKDGVISAISNGVCKIYVTIVGTSICDSCVVVVLQEKIPPTITFSELKSEGQDLVLEKVNDTKYHIKGAHATKMISGYVDFYAAKTLHSVAITFNANQVSSWGISILDWSSDWITSRIEQPQNGAYNYIYSGGKSSKFSFKFIPRGSDPVSIPITYSITDKQGTRTSIELIFMN